MPHQLGLTLAQINGALARSGAVEKAGNAPPMAEQQLPRQLAQDKLDQLKTALQPAVRHWFLRGYLLLHGGRGPARGKGALSDEHESLCVSRKHLFSCGAGTRAQQLASAAELRKLFEVAYGHLSKYNELLAGLERYTGGREARIGTRGFVYFVVLCQDAQKEQSAKVDSRTTNGCASGRGSPGVIDLEKLDNENASPGHEPKSRAGSDPGSGRSEHAQPDAARVSDHESSLSHGTGIGENACQSSVPGPGNARLGFDHAESVAGTAGDVSGSGTRSPRPPSPSGTDRHSEAGAATPEREGEVVPSEERDVATSPPASSRADPEPGSAAGAEAERCDEAVTQEVVSGAGDAGETGGASSLISEPQAPTREQAPHMVAIVNRVSAWVMAGDRFQDRSGDATRALQRR